MTEKTAQKTKTKSVEWAIGKFKMLMDGGHAFPILNGVPVELRQRDKFFRLLADELQYGRDLKPTRIYPKIIGRFFICSGIGEERVCNILDEIWV